MDWIFKAMRRAKKVTSRLAERAVLARVMCYSVFGLAMATVLVTRQAMTIAGEPWVWVVAGLAYLLLATWTVIVYVVFAKYFWYWKSDATG